MKRWVDADLILVNPSIPLEIFLPPSDMDDVHFLGGRDQNCLNTGTFFLRVSAWSVHMLTKALALPLTHPEIDLGNSMDQVAMAKIMGADYGTEEAAKQHFSRFCLCSTLIHHRDTRENLPSPACTAAVMLIRSSSRT